MFRRKAELTKRAALLVQISKASVISLLVPLMDKKPLLKELIKDSGESFDFFMTLATVSICAFDIPETVVPKKDQEYFVAELEKALYSWDKHAPQALANLNEYLHNFYQSDMQPHWGFGCWVIHNLKGEEPTYEEMNLGAMLGDLLEKKYKDQILGAI